MRYLLIIVFLFPFLVFSQTETSAEKIKRISDIRQAVISLVDDYKSNVKVSSRNEDDFYDLFSENEKIVNDVIPSKDFGKLINATDWIDIFKGNRIYSVDIDILEISEISEYDLDSGFVNVIIEKNVRSAMWNSSIKPNFGVNLGENKNQNINFNYSNKLIMKIGYRVNYRGVPVKIISIKPVNKLTNSYALVPKVKQPFLKKTTILKDRKLLSQQSIDLYGDNIPYFFEKEYDPKKMSIIGYASPKLSKDTTGFVRDLIYREKLPVSVFLLNLDVGTKLDFGGSLEPSTYEYQQKTNLSASIPVFSIPNPKLNFLSIGVKANINSSETNITNNQFQSSFNSVDNVGYDYTRINTVTNYNETLTYDQQSLFLSVNIDAKKSGIFKSKKNNDSEEENEKKNNKEKKKKVKFSPNFSGIINILLASNNTFNSNRSASAQYSAQYGPDLFNVLIEDNVAGEDFGSYELSKNEDIEIIHEIAQIIEVGAKADIDINNFSINLSFMTSINRAPWLTKQYDQISTNESEFNSIILNTESFSINRMELGIGVTFKL